MSLSNHSLLHSVTYQTIPEHTLCHFPNKTREHFFTSRALIFHTLVTSQALPECSLSLPKQYLSTHSFTSRALFYQTVTSQALPECPLSLPKHYPSALCHFPNNTRAHTLSLLGHYFTTLSLLRSCLRAILELSMLI